MLKVKGENKSTIDVGDLKEGQVAVISRWYSSVYLGRVVIRHCADLITVGECNEYWEDFLGTLLFYIPLNTN